MNVKALTVDELNYINEEYSFKLLIDQEGNKYVSVSCKSYPKRNVIHPISESFRIKTRFRTLVFNHETMSIWANNFADKYTLIEVADAITKLKLTYEKITNDNIEKRLIGRKDLSVKIKN